MIIKIPDILRELRKPWLEGVPEDLQRHIRFNAEIASGLDCLPEELQNHFHSKLDKLKEIEHFLADYMSAGGGTILGHSVDKETFEALHGLAQQEYFPKEFDFNAYEELRKFLEAKGVELSLARHREVEKEKFPEIAEESIPKEVFQLTKKILSLLPEHHLGHRHFKELRIGGWGNGAAKCSEYQDPVVHMFKFAVNGARRNYAGLLLHETGHSHLEFLNEAGLARGIFEGYIELPHETSFRPFAVDYLLGPESRLDEAQGLTEFAAELYLLYVVRGTELRDAIPALPENQRKPWQKLYETFRRSFEGIEYE
jgi:hypothetical protein